MPSATRERDAAIRARSQLRARLEGRRDEIEAAIATRIAAIEDPASIADPSYAAGLRRALGAALEYAFAAIDASSQRRPPIPLELLAQARMAARHGVSLDTVVRRYVCGFALLSEFLFEEADAELAKNGISLHRELNDRTAVLDGFIASVSEEYVREATLHRAPSGDARLEQVKALLAGQLLDAGQIGYALERWHVGLVLLGGELDALRQLADRLEMALLTVRPDPRTVWAWLGAQRSVDVARLVDAAAGWLPSRASLGVGEPDRGLDGWRLSHWQANAVVSLASAPAVPIATYAELGPVAALSRDDLVVESMQRIYLDPLADERGGGAALRPTLRAYFGSERNISSAAAVLGVNRQTVRNRLKTVEERIGRDLSRCGLDLELALRLDEHLPSERRPRLRSQSRTRPLR